MTRKRRAAGVPAIILIILALPGCEAARKQQPYENPLTSEMVNYRNGMALLREGKVDEALQLLKAAKATYPDDPAVANAFGLALLYKKDHLTAVSAFSDALALDPSFVEARNNRGVAWMEAGRLKEASADFQAVLAENVSRERMNAHFNLGLLSVRQDEWEAAEQHFSVVLAEDPKYLRAYRERGIVRVHREEFAEGLDDLLRYLKNDPKDASANFNAALALLTTGRRDVARKYMQRTVAAAPESEEAKKARRFLEDEPASGPSPKGR